MDIVIIGNGAAGLSAAEEIRKNNKEVKVHMVTNESYYTYYRTRLSHFLEKEFEIDDVYIHPESWYKENYIDMIFNKTVEKIDKAQKTVYLSGGDTLHYDKLLLANGSSSFMPPVKGNDKEGVFSLRSMDDVLAIQNYAKGIKKTAVIGGGLLGLEAANSLNNMGLDVTVIEFADRLLPRQMDLEGSQVVKNIVEEQGVHLLLNSQVEEITGDKVSGIKLKDGQVLEASLVLFSAGVRSNIQLAKNLGLEISRAVVVDEYMQTSEKDIYAAGDVAEFHNMSFNIWPIALEQGKIAAKSILGLNEPYDAITPSNMLNIMGIKAFSIGDIGAGEGDYKTLTDKSEHKLKKFFFKDGKLVGAILINDISLATKLKKIMDQDYTDLLAQDLPEIEKISKL
ncbi:MAG: NAD(P)/FAD-dependent oxidoreductase [Eubacteriaceae bacterium]|nr:NAD(P)/FAD-dependent oxidoreductase [Eubacteriaceae bacterium]